MADDLSQLGADPFASFDRPEPAAPPAQPPQPDTTNYGPDPFAQFDPENQPVEASVSGAFMHHAEAGVLPSLTGMAGAGMGAPVGAELGAAGGGIIAGPPGAVVGGVVGTIGGGIAGFMGGSQAMLATQDWLLKQMPESWQELLGQSEKQRSAEEQQQPIASQIGELAPFVITMRPSIIGPRAPIPTGASTLQRLWASPMTSHVLSAAMQGGTEAVSEVTSGQKVDPSRIAIATAFGLMFDKPTKLGERLSDMGARPIQMITGRGEPARPAEAPAAPVEPERLPPTIAEAADAQVIGPGITEGVFLGSEKQDPALRAAQQTAAQVEADTILPAATPDPTQTARTMEPELFAHYDELQAQRADLAASPDTASVQQHLAATDAELRAIEPEIAAAHRRAADVVQSETVEPETVPNEQNVQNGGTPEQLPAPAGHVTPEEAQAQSAAIAQEITRQLIAAGEPADRAQLLGHLGARRALTRAASIGESDALGLYQREGAVVRGVGRGGVPEPTAGPETPPAGPMDRQALADYIANGGKVAAGEREFNQPAYHGTPHIFDKFDSSKIGTGEGAQAFGHGLYFAGRKGVAEYYRDKLSTGAAFTKDGGTEKLDYRKLVGDLTEAAAKHVDLAKNPADADLPLFIADQVGGTLWGGESLSALRKVLREKYPDHGALIDATIEAATHYKPTKPGSLFTVDVPEHHELMDWDKPLSEQPAAVKEKLSGLGIDVAGAAARRKDDYLAQLAFASSDAKTATALAERMVDGPASERTGPASEKNWAELSRLAPELDHNAIHDIVALRRDTMTGEEAYKALSDKLGSDDKASAALREAGIPGHRFLDQQSRADWKITPPDETTAGDWMVKDSLRPNSTGLHFKTEADAKAALAGKQAESTHNYVIYDDSRVNVTSYEQDRRGNIYLAEGQRPIIRLFKDADASTFIHESGHQWLDEMMRDALHPQATDALKDDAQTVRDWLGIKDIGDRVTKRQHEKWARATEQWMREGVAPSAALARVFAQFRQWLTQIYRTARELGAPINDDIRGVFDRLIETNPQRTVIAPEQLERTPTLHDIHEAEAQDVTPEQAGPAADRIVAERDDYLARQPAEIRNELETAIAQQEAERAEAGGGTGAVGEADAGAEPGEAVGDAGGEPVAQPEGGAGGSQPRPELGSGGDGIPEGGNGPELRSNGPGVAGDARSLPPEPAPAINRAPKFIDKAGNIRLDNINSTDDIKQVLRDFAEQNNDFIDYRRGVVSKGQILDLATAIGETHPDFLMRRRIGQAFNGEEIKYAEKMLAQSAQSLALTMKPGAGASPAEVQAYAVARSRHQMIQAHFAGITAEAGRAFAALKRTQSFWSPEAAAADKASREATGRTLNQLQQEMALGAELDTPDKVSRFLRDQDKKNAVDGLLEYWISALLSGTKTWIVNDVSNFVTAVNHFGPDIAAAALAGRVRKALGRQGPRVHASEIKVAAQAAGERGIPIGVKAMLDAFKAGRGVDLPEQTETPTLPFVESAPDLFKGPVLDETATYREIIPEVYGVVKGAADAVITNGKLLAAGGVAGSPLVSLRDTATGVIPNLAIRGVEIPVGDTVRLPLRNLSAHDSFFRAANYTIEKARTAYRTALEEGLQPGTSKFDRRVAQVSETFTPEQMTEAADVAHSLTFMGRRGPFTSALVRLANSRPFNMPLPKFIVPFVSTPLAIIESAVVHRTPLAFLAPEVRADLMGTNGNIAQDMAVGRLLMGTVYGIAGAGLASMGLLSGSGPQNSNDAAAWRMAGNQAHSVRIGDMWYQINQLGPIGLWLSMVADGHDVAGAVAQGDWGTVFGGIQQAFAQNIVDMSSLTGVSDLMQAIQDPDRYGTSYVSKFLASFVPAILAQAAKSTDPYQRQAQGILESAQARVPFSSQSLPVRRDIWGAPLPQNMPAYGTVYSAKVQTDPLNRAFMDGGYWPGYPKKTIRGVKLTEQQFDEYSMVSGRLLRQNLTPAVMSSQWGTLPEAKKHDILSKAVKMSRESARNYMLAKFPNIGIEATRAKQGAAQD